MEKSFEEEKGLPSGVTQEQIKAWKDKYGENKLKQLSLSVEEGSSEQIHPIVRVPDRVTLSHFERWSESDPDKAKSIMVNNCCLTHKEQIQSNDYLFFTTVKSLAKLIPIGEAEIKNL